MEKAVLYAGIKDICEFFGQNYKPEAIRLIEPAVLSEPAFAMMEAITRVKVEFSPRAIPPIAKVRDIICQEGRKIRDEEITAREREAARARKELPAALPVGDDLYGKTCRKFLTLALSGQYDKGELREMALKGEERFPGRGFDAWINGCLKG